MNLCCGCVVDERRRKLVVLCASHRSSQEVSRFLEALNDEHYYQPSKLNGSRYAQLQRLRIFINNGTPSPAE